MNINEEGDFKTFVDAQIIGMVEYIFFEVVASEYVPAYPSTIGQTVLERVKTNIKTL